MKLPENTTVYIGGRVFKGEIPNHFEDRLPEKVKRKIPESQKPQKREKRIKGEEKKGPKEQ